MGEGDGVHQHVHASPAFLHQFDRRGDLFVAGDIAGEREVAAKLGGNGLHAFLDGFAGVAEGKLGAVLLEGRSDAVGDALIVGDSEDEAFLVLQQHDFLVVGT